MKPYDPLQAPNAEAWLALSETDRLALVQAHHRKVRVRSANLPLHATLHAVVENQAAPGDETPVRQTLARLVGEGLDRHEATHAIAATLTAHMGNLVRGGAPNSDPNAPCFAALEKLTARNFRRDFD